MKPVESKEVNRWNRKCRLLRSRKPPHRRMLWAYATGMGLYLGDGILCLIFQDWIEVVVHIIALFLLFRGFLAYAQLSRLESQGGV